MRRRAVLTVLGTLSSTTAGCVAVDPPRSADGGNGETAAGSRTPDSADTCPECPSFATESDRAVCWPAAGRIRTRVSLDASASVFESDTDDSTVGRPTRSGSSVSPWSRCDDG